MPEVNMSSAQLAYNPFANPAPIAEEIDLSEDINPVDTAQFVENYSEGNDKKGLPLPGKYAVQIPELPDSSFTKKKDAQGHVYLDILLDNQMQGNGADSLTIHGGAYDGYAIRYIRVSTQVRPATSWNRSTKSFAPITKEDGTPQVYSDAVDLLRNFGVNTVPESVEAWKQAIRDLAGRVSPSPFYFTWEGKAAGSKNDAGYAVRVKQAEFKQPDGSFKQVVERTAEVSFEMKLKGVPTTINIGEKYPVFANLRLGIRGAAKK